MIAPRGRPAPARAMRVHAMPYTYAMQLFFFKKNNS
eukprot:SAG31_NODE_30262_length_383_cov_1.052817_1_plen_35_part_01